jgi:hypothetical protein
MEKAKPRMIARKKDAQLVPTRLRQDKKEKELT